MNLQNHIIKCHSCNKELGKCTFETFAKVKKGRAFINGEWRIKFYCSEECKNKYESQMRNARTKSNVGLSTMPFNLSTGASLKILGDGDYLRASSNLRTVKTELSEANKELKILERELDKLKKQWLSERKEAELIVEGDSIYIKGDDAKRDILSGVKKARQDARDVIQKIESNPKVIEYLASEADIKAKFANSPFETFKEHRSSKSKFYSKLRNVGDAANIDTYDIVYDHIVPRSNFYQDAWKIITRKIEDKEAEIRRINKEYEELKPTFLQKIFPFSFKKKKNELNIQNQYKIQRITKSIEECKVALENLEDLQKEFLPYYTGDMQKSIDRYLFAKKVLESNGQKDILERKAELEEKLANNNTLMYSSNIISNELKNYLLETNQSLNIETLMTALQGIADVAPELMFEIENVVEGKKGKLYEPVTKRRY
jgi:hypothetical protein